MVRRVAAGQSQVAARAVSPNLRAASVSTLRIAVSRDKRSLAIADSEIKDEWREAASPAPRVLVHRAPGEPRQCSGRDP